MLFSISRAFLNIKRMVIDAVASRIKAIADITQRTDDKYTCAFGSTLGLKKDIDAKVNA